MADVAEWLRRLTRNHIGVNGFIHCFILCTNIGRYKRGIDILVNLCRASEI